MGMTMTQKILANHAGVDVAGTLYPADSHRLAVWRAAHRAAAGATQAQAPDCGGHPRTAHGSL